MTRHARHTVSLAVLAVLLGAAPAALAAERGFDYHAEHLFESAVDARHLGLPWTVGRIASGRWSSTVSGGLTSTGNALADLEGYQLGVGVRYGFSETRAVEALLFDDRLEVSGDGGTDQWRPAVLGLGDGGPWQATFTELAGDVHTSGLGGGGVWQRQSTHCAACRRTLRAGLFWERLDVSSYTAVLTFEEGPEVGTSALVDLSGRYDFVVPYVELETTRPLGRSFTFSPSLVVLMPFPRQAMPARLTRGQETEEGQTRGAPVGDGVLGFGLRLHHLASGLSIDLGSSLSYAVLEPVVHPGVGRALTVQLSWHRG